ncbi:hypothetical protein CPB83DRAFT_858890 [Crepidotus variabilis]|uniref:F-box domain-containing protein n=1 Tax=Crepidotus variabilis TaxID=179855 RepID=A0A9P6EBG8_9AGAR|nr:hypothetical protein CPB83DRAFT_858890 [Crepidotus variabilis]
MGELEVDLEPETHRWVESLSKFLKRFSRPKKCGEEHHELPGVDYTVLIPTVALSRIFLLFVQSTTPTAFAPCVEAITGHGPMLLSHVCRRWRQIAIEKTPSLWSSIYVGPHPLLTQNRVTLVRIWLLRSGKESLHIRLDSGYACPRVQRPTTLHKTLGGVPVHQDGSSGGMPSKDISQKSGQIVIAPSFENQITLTEELFGLFAIYIDRWKSFSFAQGSSPEQPGVYLPLNQLYLSRALSLQKLSIRVIPPATNSACWMSTTEPTDTLDGIQSLPHSVLERLQFHWEHPSALQPQLIKHSLFSQLSRIRLSSGLDMYQAVSFLFICATAKEIRLDCIHDDYMEPLPPTPLSKSFIHTRSGKPRVARLPNLKVLQVADCVGDFTMALDHLCCPAMDILEFRTFETSTSSVTSLQEFLKRSKCHISRLSVIDYNTSVGNEMIALPYIPALEFIPTVGINLKRQIPKESPPEGYEFFEQRWNGTWIGKGSGNVVDICSSFLFC